MEAPSKLNHDLHPRFLLDISPSKLQGSHVYSTLHFLRSPILVLVFFTEASLILWQWRPIYFLLPLLCFLVFFIFESFLAKSSPIFLVDFSCLRPPKFCKISFSTFIEHASMIECFDKKSIDFMAKIISSSGQGEETYLPPSLHYIPPRTHQEDCIKEVHMLLFPVMDDLLSKTKISPRDVDILIVNCSGFCSSPSLSSIVVNKYCMRADIKSFNLSGMGCSASSIGIHMASNLLQSYKNSYAVVLSTEILSTGWYAGNEPPKLLLNCLFRMGSAAILLTNRNKAKESSKYKLLQTVRTQRAFDDKAYFSAIREEDSKGITGFSVNQDILQVVGETLRSHITIFGASILPLKEKIRHRLSILKRYINPSGDIYVPDFRSVIQHYCIPTSGKAFLREIGKGLKLTETEMEASLMTLHRFGNQSSASMWYELAYIEAKERVKKGEKVWQLGLGSGMKCSSVVWECLKPIVDESKKGPWSDCIDRYPIIADKPYV
ncbi:hypothetical protein HHK36_027844 [Tetracentron sinense]|uniref:3-ketoacyl-CoA synthase n=1 Tax=Tetracentron sinense TaxID=13715 RepID=A0A834YFJ0_TETSI|nr:hypothetical protein HHK36_027844 [Tetracentron sinense]